jgi:outer membrane lipoprotein-sorting protein
MKLLLAAVLLVQDKSAEEMFKKIEDGIETAKTVRVVFHCAGQAPLPGGDQEVKSTGTLLLKEGNRINIFQRITAGGQEQELRHISDGATLLRRWPGGLEDTNKTPDTLSANVGIALARTWAQASFGGSGGPGSLTGKKLDLREKYQVSDFKTEPDEKEAKVLSYKVTPKRGDAMQITLFYDPQKLVPLKRTIRTLKPDEVMTLTETYEEFVLNADIPDEKFKLPEEKK